MTWLHRAIVNVPRSKSSGFDERIVFFDVPTLQTKPGAYLEQLLASIWQCSVEELEGCIYNIWTEYELGHRSYAGNDLHRGDLCLLATGCGGEPPLAVGPDRIHFADPNSTDLYVSPRHARRIRLAFDRVELMRRAQERGDDAKAPAWIVGQARDEILAAAVLSKVEGHGPILRASMRPLGEAYNADILVDASRLSAPTLAALKRIEGVTKERGARRPKPAPDVDACAGGHDMKPVDRGPTWTLSRCTRCPEENRNFYD